MLKIITLPILSFFTLFSLSACQTPSPTLQSPFPVVNIDEDMDSDNDGVPNSRDKCPRSPFDVIIDENGCTVTK